MKQLIYYNHTNIIVLVIITTFNFIIDRHIFDEILTFSQISTSGKLSVMNAKLNCFAKVWRTKLELTHHITPYNILDINNNMMRAITSLSLRQNNIKFLLTSCNRYVIALVCVFVCVAFISILVVTISVLMQKNIYNAC